MSDPNGYHELELFELDRPDQIDRVYLANGWKVVGTLTVRRWFRRRHYLVLSLWHGASKKPAHDPNDSVDGYRRVQAERHREES